MPCWILNRWATREVMMYVLLPVVGCLKLRVATPARLHCSPHKSLLPSLTCLWSWKLPVGRAAPQGRMMMGAFVCEPAQVETRRDAARKAVFLSLWSLSSDGSSTFSFPNSSDKCLELRLLILLLFSCSVMSDSATPWTAAHQASLSITISRSLLKLMSIE